MSSFETTNTQKFDGKWQVKTPTNGVMERFCPVPISLGTSIWFVQNYAEEVDSGIVEYQLDSDTTKPAIPYPVEFVNKWGQQYGALLISCKNEDDLIVVVNLVEGIGIVFNAKTRKYGNVFIIPFEFASEPSCVVIGDFVHIFHGDKGELGDYAVRSLTGTTSLNHTKRCCGKPGALMHGVAVTKTNDSYQSSNKWFISRFARTQTGGDIPADVVALISKFNTFELFRFGGFENTDRMNSFWIGTLENEDPTEPINWKMVPQYTLEQPMNTFGYIQHGPFIVTFGGSIHHDTIIDLEGAWYSIDTDAIYILDLRKHCGWIQSPIKCPEKSQYHAVLDNAHCVHLYTIGDNDDPSSSHYCLELTEIIPELM